jgi:hypothetical protein
MRSGVSEMNRSSNLFKVLLVLFFFATLQSHAIQANPVPAVPNPAPGFDFDPELARKFLLDEHPLTRLDEMAKNPSLMSHSVTSPPWSSTYMPAVMGYAGAPYGGQNGLSLILSFPFMRGYQVFMKERLRELGDFRRAMTELQLESLSPSEKYDLITGTLGTDQSLTYQLWQQAKQNHDLDGITTWTGMCNGWGPASIIFKRPERRIFVPSADGRYMVPFFPDDLKQLASTLFFNTTTVEAELDPAKFNVLGKMPMVGKRCWDNHPKRDGSGVELRSDCADVSASFWHVSVVNLIGKQDQAFVADINPAGPVANYPLRGYRFSFFNPITEKEGSLAQSSVTRAAFAKDPYSKHRSSKAVSIVGVKMSVDYTHYVFPKLRLDDSASKDDTKKLELEYDLELDRSGEIVGGQWRGKLLKANHPDFIWYPPRNGIGKGDVATLPSAGEYNASRIGYTGQYDASATGDWDPSQPLPPQWRELAKKATSTRVEILLPGEEGKSYRQIRPQPLGKIVYELFEQASY